MSRINKRALAFPFVTGAFIASSLALSTVLFPANTTNAAGNSAGVEVGTKVGEFISLALDTSNLVLEDSNGNTTIIPTAAGTLVTGNVEAAVSTNTPKGYTLSVYTEDQSTGMTHSNSSISTAINSISTATGYNASTGISDLAGDTWGFRNNVGGTLSNWFAVGANSSNGTVVASPDSSSSTYCDTISYPLNNSGCANSSYGTHTVNFGAKLTSALPAGSYSNNVVFSAIAKSEGTSYTVNFNSNGGNNTMGSRTIIAGSTFTIPSTSNVTKDGYEIAGYAFTSNASTAAYTPGQTVTVADFLAAATSAGQTPDSGMTLYIIWQKLEDPTIMQSSNSCSNIPEGQTATLTDARDNQEYTVYHIPSNAVYPDTSTVANVAGKCIMTKDLNLGAVASVEGSASTIVANGAMTLSPEDSNFTTPTSTDYEGITVPTTSVSITNGSSSWPTTNSYSNKQYITSGTGDYANRGYYSWGAAMTVCPKGWRLPTQDEYNNNDSSYNASTTGISKLVNNNLSTIQSSPWSFVLGGNYNRSFGYAGSNGGYWSSTQYGSENSYRLLLHSNGLRRLSNNKYLGFSVRCIAD